MRPTAVPTLAEVAAHPELLDEVPAPIAAAIILHAQAIITRAATRIAAAPAHGVEADRVLDTAEAAQMLGISPGTLAHSCATTHRHLVVRIGRRRGFSLKRIQDYLRRGGDTPGLPAG